MCMQHIRKNNLDLGKLTDAIVGGAPMPPPLLRESAMQLKSVALKSSRRLHNQEFSCLALTVC